MYMITDTKQFSRISDNNEIIKDIFYINVNFQEVIVFVTSKQW